MYYYSKTSPTHAEQELAWTAARFAAKKLRMLKPPAMFFIRETPNGGSIEMQDRIYACSDSLTIFIRTGLEPRRLCECVAHEICHVRYFFQHKRSLDIGELQAQIFGLQFMSTLDSRSYEDLTAELILKLYGERSKAPALSNLPISKFAQPARRALGYETR